MPWRTWPFVGKAASARTCKEVEQTSLAYCGSRKVSSDSIISPVRRKIRIRGCTSINSILGHLTHIGIIVFIMRQNQNNKLQGRQATHRESVFRC